MKGAPIRFVAAVLGGWTCIRIAVLLPDAERLKLVGDVLAPRAAAAGRPAMRAVPLPWRRAATVGHEAEPSAAAPWRIRPAAGFAAAISAQAKPEVALARIRSHDPDKAPPWPALVVPTLGSGPSRQAPSRWATSAWLLTRGGANGTVTGGRLGASQAGLRMTYRLDVRRRIALAARIAAPLQGRGTEVAIGLDWQPTAAAVHLVAEHRIGIDGAQGRPTVMVIAGLDPVRLAAGFQLEAYAQGGAILRGGKAQAFGDGAIRLSRPMAVLGPATLDLGLGAWGGAQPGATRVDLGPTIGVALPVAGRNLRLSLDWRQRVAGTARPGSGPALSIGSDF